MSYDLAETRQILDVATGEVLPATTENAHRVLRAAREMKSRLDGVIAETTDFLREESRRQGTKTFRTAAGTVVLTGGPTVDYDPEALAESLREAGCPEERVEEVVKAEVTYKVDRGVLRQLVGANPDYAAAAKLAERPSEKRWSAKAT